MCGRYGLTTEQEALSAALGVEHILFSDFPRYNIAPTQNVPVLLEDPRCIEGFRWGLIPSWAKDPSIGNRLINARSETVATKPSFRGAWKHRRRCAVLATGFYEWQKPPSGKGPKRPHWIALKSGGPFGFAGLWETWDDVRSCTILTTGPNELVRPIHDRMPVILTGDALESWTDPAVAPEEVQGLMAPYPADRMTAWEVSTYVNRPGNEGPDCVAPV